MSNQRPVTTIDAGIPVASDGQSLAVGPDGPILLNEHYLIEQIANFNRERIPELQPHAKGAGAFGYCKVTHDVSQYTRAAVPQPGTRTETGIRFSTLAVGQSSPDSWWDPRGFLVREVFDDAARDRLVSTVVRYLLGGVSEPILERAFQHWKNIDQNIGERIEKGVRAGQA
jgi:catalase